jgi:hypothetical protein
VLFYREFQPGRRLLLNVFKLRHRRSRQPEELIHGLCKTCSIKSEREKCLKLSNDMYSKA